MKSIFFLLKFAFLLSSSLFVSFAKEKPHYFKISVSNHSSETVLRPLTSALKKAHSTFKPKSHFHVTLGTTQFSLPSHLKWRFRKHLRRIFPVKDLTFIPLSIEIWPKHSGGYWVVLLPKNASGFHQINTWLYHKNLEQGFPFTPLTTPASIQTDRSKRSLEPIYTPHITLGTCPDQKCAHRLLSFFKYSQLDLLSSPLQFKKYH